MADPVSLGDLPDDTHVDLFPGAEPRTVCLTLAAGEAVPPHTHPDRQVVLSVREGHLAVTLDDETHHLEPGDVVRFDGRREVSPRAVEDSTALVVLAPRAD
ncbi:MAG: cupin domain-containing protein [Halorientalis sp.]